MKLEYRVCWTASTHHNFGGATDWEPWGDDDATSDEIEEALVGGPGGSLSQGLEMALEGSGFGWHVETREGSPDA